MLPTNTLSDVLSHRGLNTLKTALHNYVSYMGLVARIHVIRVILKRTCCACIRCLASILSTERTAMEVVKLRGCAGGSVSFLFIYSEDSDKNCGCLGWSRVSNF